MTILYGFMAYPRSGKMAKVPTTYELFT